MSSIFKFIILSILMLPAISYGKPLERLKCNVDENQAQPEVSGEGDLNETEAVPVCPDCEKLKAKGGEAALSIPRELHAQDEVQRFADYSLVKGRIASRSGESPEQLQERVDKLKSKIALTQSCVKGKWSNEAMPVFEVELSRVRSHCNDSSFLPENKNIKRQIKGMKSDRAPSRRNLNSFCQGWIRISLDGTNEKDWKKWLRERIPGLETKLKQYQEQLDFIKSNNTTAIPELGDEARNTGAADCDIKYDEYRAIYRYTESFYRCINMALRGEDNCLKPDELRAVVRIINRGLTKIAPHVGEVYRGIKNLPKDILEAHQEGAVIQFSSYLSTAATKEKSFTGNYKYIIQSKTGRLIAPLSGSPHENEVLFAPMAKFKITKIVGGIGFNAAGKIFYLEEIQ